ncbi:MAG: hypothetical protein HY335_07710, partial [Deinococcus sp.]|nr:hypothetical protein [Deinococcus sp.]
MNRISLLSGIALVAWALSGCIPGAAGTLAGIVLTLDQPVQGSFAPGDRSLREVLRGQGFTDQALDAILPGLGVGGGTFTDAYQFQGTAG